MKSKQYKIGITGLGPVGQILAVHFKEAGCDVPLLDKNKEKVNLIRHKGITLDGVIRKSVYFSKVNSSMDAFLENDLDLVIFSLKTHQVDGLLEQLEGRDLSGLRMLCAQNGIDTEQKFRPVFAESQILRMVMNFAGNLHAPNVVNVTFFNPPNYVASIDDTQGKVAQWVADTLNRVGLETMCLDSFSITDRVWEKTILNASLSALCGISRLTMREAMAIPDTVEIVEQTILEAIEVGKEEGIHFPDNFVKICLRYLRKGGDHFPSLAVDLLNKRETEISYFNGKIVEYGRKHYIRTPINLLFTNLILATTQKNLVLKKTKKPFFEEVVDV